MADISLYVNAGLFIIALMAVYMILYNIVIYKKLFVISLLTFALIPIGFTFENTFRSEWYGGIGIGFIFAGVFNGTVVLIISLGLLDSNKVTK